MIFAKKTAWLLLIYVILRVFSFLFGPETPLHASSWVNSLISLLILALTIYLLVKKNEQGWYVVAGELLFGGAGGFLAVGVMSLRTLLLISSLAIFFTQKITNKRLVRENRIFVYLLLGIFLIIFLASTRAYFFGHNPRMIIADAIPYFFFLYYFPLKELLASVKFKEFVLNAFIVAVFGNALFILLTFAGFSSGLVILQDPYYHWYRDVALGKITDIGFGSFRLVLDEHLLLVPILLWVLHSVIATPSARGKQSPRKQRDRRVASLLAMTLLFTLAINLTRIYLVALMVGLLFLFSKTNWKRWLTVSLSVLMIFIISFTAAHLAASRGQNLGWELFGVKIQSMAYPAIEDSSQSRMILLPKIIEKIKSHLIWGNGLGDTVIYFSPVFKQNITTPNFDWGYLEIFDEIGIIGLLIWILVIGYLILKIYRSNLESKKGLLASFISLLIINITSPALFHVFGVMWLAGLLAITTVKSNDASPAQFSLLPRIPSPVSSSTTNYT